jgi:glycine/D-amino acid oxidase-like deaminating enzyme
MDLRTGCAFWMVKDGLLASYPPLAADLSSDVAIIGAGITGALVARELTNAGASVVVLDRRDVASGSTAASTGLLQYETDASLETLSRSVGLPGAVRIYRLGLEAIDEIERICAEVGDSSGFRRRPCLYLASTRRDARALAREHAVRASSGFDVTWLTAAEV